MRRMRIPTPSGYVSTPPHPMHPSNASVRGGGGMVGGPCVLSPIAAMRHPLAMTTRELASFAKRWTKSLPVAISYVTVGGKKIRQVIATQDLERGSTVAAYPVEIALHQTCDDATKKKPHHDFKSIVGIPSNRAMERDEKKHKGRGRCHPSACS